MARLSVEFGGSPAALTRIGRRSSEVSLFSKNLPSGTGRLAVRRGPGATSLNYLALDAMCQSLLDVELQHGVLQAVISGPSGTVQYKEPLSDTFHGSTVQYTEWPQIE